MGRPGQRPYECVKKAWHSDRHQPMRGSLIQEIFRVANEVHSLSTRKNKEWQEKLPTVVLKAEEIMYSKANSEVEYMDLKTLWNRANDAIDTIIRRDDTPESGDLLQPCIEAALNLGCIPRRASRSQRHNNPGVYLSSSTRDAAAVPHEVSDTSKAHLGSSTQLLPLPPHHPNNLSSPSLQSASWYSTSVTPTTHNSGLPSKTASFAHESSRLESLPYLSKDNLLSCPDGGLSIPMETCTLPNMGRVYPLYYNYNQPKMSFQPALQIPEDPVSPKYTSIGKVPTGFLQNFLHSNPSSVECDLSLRLGLPSPPSLESTWTPEFEDVGSSSSCDGRARAINFGSSSSSSKDKGFDFFHLDTVDDPLESCSSKGSSEGEDVFYVEASGRKRGPPLHASFRNEYVSWKQKIARVP